MRRRWIMHVDMDAFYASVEQRDHPQWRGLPVIVGASERRGVVATASYEARAYGVHSALAGSIARQRCPQGIFVRPRMHVYREVSALIHEVLYRYAPEIEPLSLDEAFLDISGMGTQFPTLKALGRSVQRDIYDAVGLSASVGIGGNKFLAKLASDLEKPHGLVIIPYEQAQEMIASLPVRRLWGVGPKLEADLETLGYVTIADVAAADPDQLVRQIGQQGKTLWELAHARDDRPIVAHAPRKSIGEEETFAEDLHADADIRRYLLRASDTVARRLRQKGLVARTVTLKLRYGSYKTLTRSVTLADPIDLPQALSAAVFSLYNKLKLTEGIRLLGVTVSGLLPAGTEPMSLFADGTARERKAQETIDKLQDKYGPTAIRRGFWWDSETTTGDERGKKR
ncbi:DNA polymerase IV [Negativicoccus succinicivorans]|uniref:DNA polymerase IV n=1 Tax=Negativicoccus succinicivorans TaxID=620903 RepID=UPI0025895578|nr:DNA polymerase IV [Negativicoccus succinicivorans]MDU4558549.1 DNA polymerase IV [Negativicoccus succinicivorans]MDU4575758.1 DNA polymerase IV [Negativicoccus succinicivorans]